MKLYKNKKHNTECPHNHQRSPALRPTLSVDEFEQDLVLLRLFPLQGDCDRGLGAVGVHHTPDGHHLRALLVRATGPYGGKGGGV